ncbi:MAG: type II toxin-antitoxin system Phd/YefM family antitoxin [Actinomycetota bacterium]
MTATAIEARLLAGLDDVAEGEEIEITKHGRTVALLVSAKGRASSQAMLRGVAVSAAEDEELFSTAAEWRLD